MLSIAVDLREQLEAVRDQGRRPTCLAFAASASHRVAHQHPGALSPEWLYYHATKRDGLRPDQGSTLQATREVVSEDGQPEEAFWPYDGSANVASPYRPPVGHPELLKCDTGSRDGNPQSWRRALDLGSAVIVAIFISSTFFGPPRFEDSEAVMPDDQGSIDEAMAHAIALAGYGDLQGKPHFLVRNSWGRGWGWDGYAWLPEGYLTRRFAGAFVIKHGASDDVQSHDTFTDPSLRVG